MWRTQSNIVSFFFIDRGTLHFCIATRHWRSTKYAAIVCILPHQCIFQYHLSLREQYLLLLFFIFINIVSKEDIWGDASLAYIRRCARLFSLRTKHKQQPTMKKNIVEPILFYKNAKKNIITFAKLKWLFNMQKRSNHYYDYTKK